MLLPRIFLFICATILLPPVAPLRAQFFGVPSKADASLVADTTSITPGKTFTVGIHFKIAKNWHLYWRFPGDSGAAPSVVWELPKGLEAGQIRWPLPHSLKSDGDVFTNVYEEELLLPVEFRVSPDFQEPSATIHASLKWYVCSETCLPGEDKVSLTIPVAGDAPAKAAHAELFESWKKRLPETGPAPFTSGWKRTGEALLVTLANLPGESYPELFPIPPEKTTPENPVRSQDADGAFTFRIPVKAGALDGQWAALIVLNSRDGHRRGWEITLPPAETIPGAAVQKSAGAPATENGVDKAGGSSFLAVLWTAFLGGLIMNLMPCVLPVIALKLFNFTRQAGEDPRKVFALGLSYCGGVIAFFIGLALAVIGLQKAGGSLNWGFQFQNPWILLGLISAVFVFGMNLLGVFEITLASGANEKLSELSSKEGHFGAFLHGAFTTLLGTSCTAPYLGVTLGFAASQPPPRVLAIFLTIAVGMSLPYLLLTSNPALLRLMPKPGVWMERLKQIMGFAILGVAIWLLGVLGDSKGSDAMHGACVLLLALGGGCWMLGVMRSRALAWVLSFVLAAASLWGFVLPHFQASERSDSGSARETAQNAAVHGVWEPFSPEKLARELGAGKPVFVDFTASWCFNCKINEKVTLSRADVLDAFRAKGVTLLKADWSDGDPVITAELRKHERVGVPLYVLYKPGAAPFRFPEILKSRAVLDALEDLPSK